MLSSFLYVDGEGFNPLIAGSADLRTDDTNESELVRIANRMSGLSRKAQKRNSVSVEQIQDKSRRRHHKKES